VISRDDAEAVGQGRCGDPQVVRPKGMASPLEVGPDLGMDSSDRLCDRDGPETREDVFDESSPASTSGAGGSMHAMKQLADRDHADSALFVAGQRFEDPSIRRPFPVNENVGID
jgi:hypothetical protein